MRLTQHIQGRSTDGRQDGPKLTHAVIYVEHGSPALSPDIKGIKP